MLLLDIFSRQCRELLLLLVPLSLRNKHLFHRQASICALFPSQTLPLHEGSNTLGLGHTHKVLFLWQRPTVVFSAACCCPTRKLVAATSHMSELYFRRMCSFSVSMCASCSPLTVKTTLLYHVKLPSRKLMFVFGLEELYTVSEWHCSCSFFPRGRAEYHPDFARSLARQGPAGSHWMPCEPMQNH